MRSSANRENSWDRSVKLHKRTLRRVKKCLKREVRFAHKTGFAQIDSVSPISAFARTKTSRRRLTAADCGRGGGNSYDRAAAAAEGE